MIYSDGSDDVETIKAMWAYNMPCVLLVNGAKDYWSARMQPIYAKLYIDEMIPVRKSLAAGLIEVAKMLDLSSQDSSDKNSTFLLEVA